MKMTTKIKVLLLSLLFASFSLAPDPARAQSSAGCGSAGGMYWALSGVWTFDVTGGYTSTWFSPPPGTFTGPAGTQTMCVLLTDWTYSVNESMRSTGPWFWPGNVGNTIAPDIYHIRYGSFSEIAIGLGWYNPRATGVLTIWYASVGVPTPVPTHTPTPTVTPTPTNTPTPTPTPTPDLVQTQVSIGQTAVAGGTPPAAWCGYVPTHPCWVAYATRTALEDLMATVAARAASNAPQAVEVVNFPTPVPTATPEMNQYRQTATAVLAQPNPVAYTGGGTEYSSGQLGQGADGWWRVDLYDFGCPIDVSDPWQVRICVRYHHIAELRIMPAPLPAIDPLVFVGALALLVVRWFIQR